jgi:predicted hotdog family 3-hydroxylacyl-ACP dehydratase
MFPIPAAELTPHAAPMLLIDEVTSCTPDRITSRAVISSTSPFYMPGRGLPAYVGFEIMAQTIAAYDGWTRRQNGEKPAVGFLLGCRRYTTSAEWLQEGMQVEIEANSLLDAGEMKSFDCKLVGPGGALLASGVLNVYRPTDAAAFLDRTTNGRMSL